MSDMRPSIKAAKALIAEGRVGKAVDSLIDGSTTKRTAIIDALALVFELTDQELRAVDRWLAQRQERRIT